MTLVEIGGKQLKLSNLEKVLYPDAGFTKGQVIDYYSRIAPALLPHLRGRPLTLKRYPNGVDSGYFYEKQCPSHRPDWVQVAPVWSGHNRRVINFCLVEDLPTLIWVANLASLELHTALHRAAGSTGAPDEAWTPDMVVFDLDPGEPAAFAECAEVALWLREALDGLGLSCFPKTSGSKGLQLYAPLNTPATYDQTKSFARALAQVGERAHPKLVVSNMAKELRKGKILIDWSQNDEHKTTVSVFSLRARPRPTVSAPLHWSEVEAAAAGGPGPVIEAGEAVRRITEDGDLLAPLLELEQRLPAFG
ncbi:MAG TPA: non-homologous end-joining DNA ligase [Acidimicrobiia bacterium]|nr:non-homologous end-joining DNA ligase [Acidimicrobiia bacterium]